MRHSINKSKFGSGEDANQMLMRKLFVNFFNNGKIVTTIAKAKALKPHIERLIEKVKEDTEPNRNFLRRYLAKETIINDLYKNVSPHVQNKVGGYVRIEKLYQRELDGTLMARITWTHTVPVAEPTTEKAEAKSEKKETKTRARKTKESVELKESAV